MSDAQWPWLMAAGLGAFHGINPAMGWLFAVALGLHRGGRHTVLLALAPIAIGHALAVAAAAGIALALDRALDPAILRPLLGSVLIVWALLLALRGHGGRVRVGLGTGMAGLLAWSFLMATAHGAGLMLLPALLPVAGGRESALAPALAMVTLHTAAMLLVTGAVALIVHELAGLAFLRRGWINFDRLWIVALVAGGAWLLLA